MRSRRRGVSYLEVLIAAGIGLTGILGAIAIYPVASLNMQKGVTSDVMAYVGPAALDQVESFGMNEPQRWTFNNGAGWSEVENVGYNPRRETGGRPWHNSIQAWDAFCIDPRYLASAPAATAAHSPYQFPSVNSATASDLRMRRISLAPGVVVAAGVPPIMSTAQARLLFKVQDDLLFNKIEDNVGELPAAQGYLFDTGDVAQRRDYYANFEWIVTLVPQVIADASVEDLNSNPPRPPARRTGAYMASVVVYYQRQPRLDEILEYGADANFVEDERVVDLEFLADGLNGGDVSIQTRPGRPASDLALQEGQWVMLSGMQYTPAGVPNPPTAAYTAIGGLFDWYRVDAISTIYQGPTGLPRRDVTLAGSDWPVRPAASGLSYNTTPIPSLATAAGGGAATTRMTICTGVVGVFQRSVRCD